MADIIDLGRIKKEFDEQYNEDAEAAANHAIMRMQSLGTDVSEEEFVKIVFGGIHDELAEKWNMDENGRFTTPKKDT